MTIGTFDLEVVPTFPADVVATGGVKVTSTAGRFTFTLDYPTLVDNAGIVDPSRYTLAVWSADAGRYEEARIDQIISQSIGEGRTPIGDAAYTVLNSDRTVALTATLTAIRNITLPAANSVPGGREIQFLDERGGLSTAFYWNFVPTGADTIGATVSTVLAQPYGAIAFRSDGTSRWTVVKRARSLEFGLGSVALPAIFPAGDTNTGIFSPGADQIGFTTGGLVAGVWSATGGLTNRGAVDVPLGAVGTPSFTFTGDSNTGIFSPGADQLGLTTGGIYALLLDSVGAATFRAGATFVGALTGITALTASGNVTLTSTTASTSTATGAVTIAGGLGVAGDFFFGGTAWTAYTPTVASGTGSITTSTSSGGYKKLGRVVVFRATVTVTTAGTGAGALIVGLPFACTAVTALAGANGSSIALIGLTNQSSASTVSLTKVDGTTPIAGGTVYYVSGSFESTT